MDTELSGKNIALGCGGLLIAFFFLMGIFGIRSVDQGHIGLITTGGNVTGTAQPGFVHIWFPFQGIQDVDLRVQKQAFNEIDASSQELQSVKLTGTITYHIEADKAISLYTNVGTDDLEGKLLDPALQDYVKEATPQYPATEILAHRSDIRKFALQQLNAKLQANYPGLVVDDIFIANVGFSAQYESAIEAKQAAAQSVLTAQQNQDKAKIDAQTAVITAQGEAAANSARQASITAELVAYLAVQKWDGHLPITFSGAGSPFSIFAPAGK